MNYPEFHDRVVNALDQKLDALPWGTRTAIRKILKVGTSFFSDLRQRKMRLPMPKLVEIFEILGDHPAVFLYEAVKEESMPELPGDVANHRKLGDVRLEDLPPDHPVRAVMQELNWR